MHALVITGIRKMCNIKGNCVQSLKLQNSWGIAWQKAHDDGWVDAKIFLDRTFYEPFSISWFQKRDRESPIDATLVKIRENK